MRAFIAVELPAPLRRDLRTLQQKLAAALDAAGAAQTVRWTAVESIHLTLRFLGETDAAQAEALARGLKQIAAARAPLDLALANVGCFPNFRRPNVVWAGVAGDVARLLHLQAPIEELARRAGFTPETRPFSPHLTLGRFRREASPAQLGRARRASRRRPPTRPRRPARAAGRAHGERPAPQRRGLHRARHLPPLGSLIPSPSRAPMRTRPQAAHSTHTPALSVV